MAARRIRFDVRQASRQILIVLAALFAANAAAYYFVVRPQVREYRELLETSRPRFEALEERRAGVVALEEFLAGVQRAEEDLRVFREEVLSTRGERMVAVQAELARLAEQFGIDLDAVTYQHKILRDEELDRFAMVVPLEGGYANLRRFLQAVESSEEFLVVERVGLAEGQDGGVLLRLDITLATYFNLPAAPPETEPRTEPAATRPARGRA
jgi:Tfp pilus assembly protein PilO